MFVCWKTNENGWSIHKLLPSLAGNKIIGEHGRELSVSAQWRAPATVILSFAFLLPNTLTAIFTQIQWKLILYISFYDVRDFEWLLFETNPNITKEAQFSSVFPQKQKLICLGATIEDWQDGKPVTSRALVTLAEAHNRTTWGAGCDPSASHRLKYKYNQNTKYKCKDRKNTNTNVVKRKKNKYKYWYSQTTINF